MLSSQERISWICFRNISEMSSLLPFDAFWGSEIWRCVQSALHWFNVGRESLTERGSHVTGYLQSAWACATNILLFPQNSNYYLGIRLGLSFGCTLLFCSNINLYFNTVTVYLTEFFLHKKLKKKNIPWQFVDPQLVE